MKLKARQISSEFGATVATAAVCEGGSTGVAEGRKGTLEVAAAAVAGAAGGEGEAEGAKPRHRRRLSSTVCVLS